MTEFQVVVHYTVEKLFLIKADHCVQLSRFSDMYRCARSSDWGDQMPIIPKIEGDIEEIQTDDPSA